MGLNRYESRCVLAAYESRTVCYLKWVFMVGEIVGQRLRSSGVHAALVGYNCNHDLNALCAWWWIDGWVCMCLAGWS